MKKRTGQIPAPSWRDLCQQAYHQIEALNRQLAARNLAEQDLQRQAVVQQENQQQDMRRMLLEIIEVTDAFANLFSRIDPALNGADARLAAWTGNFRTVYKMQLRALQRCGVALLTVEPGMTADPALHHIVEVSADPSQANETILEVIRPGYLWQDTLLRAAEVRTVKNC